MKTFSYEGKNYKVFKIKMFGTEYEVIVLARTYRVDNSLALEVMNIEDGELEPFGVLTVNIGNMVMQSDTNAFVKTYSENEGWAKDLAKKIGGVDTGLLASNGYVTFPLFDFSNLSIYAN